MVGNSLPGQTLQARLTGDEREREGGSADSEQDSVIQWNVYYVMTTLNLNCACDPCVTSYYRISTESHDCCNLIGSANIPAEPTVACSESADPLSLSLSSPLARPLVFRSSPVKRARRVCPGRLGWKLERNWWCALIGSIAHAQWRRLPVLSQERTS